jgi:hypothetical protein
MTKLYVQLAEDIQAYKSVEKNGSLIWRESWKDEIYKLVKNHMPSGSGIDSGVELDFEKSTGEKLVFNTSYHHMNEVGMYDGWTEHQVIVTASLVHGITLRITGRNRNDIKDYLHDVFHEALMKEID